MPLAIALFVVLALGVVFLSAKQSLICFLLLSNVSLSGWESSNVSSVGIDTLIKAVVLPCCLIVKLGVKWQPWREWSLPSKLWAALTAYAVIASSWSPNKLAAMKMIVYLVSYALIFAIFAKGWSQSWLTPSALAKSSGVVIFIATIQSYAVGNPFSVDEGRFTSFTSPQYFAAYLVCILTIVLWSETQPRLRWSSIFALLGCIILSGSRYVFLGTLAIGGLFWLTVRSRSRRQVREVFKHALAGLLVILAGGWTVHRYLPNSRLNELAESYHEESVSPVGTMVWRLAIYGEAVQQIEDRWSSDLGRFSLGSGTSSGLAVLSDLSANYLEAQDANRCIHDEFVRAMYEWGVIGLGLFLSFLVSTFWRHIRSAVYDRSGPALVLTGILPTLLLGLAFENILAGPVAAGGTGYALVLSYGAVFCSRTASR